MATLTIENMILSPGPVSGDLRANITWDADGKRWAESFVIDSTASYATVWAAIDSRKAEVDEQINSTYQITCQDGTVLTWP